MNKQEIEKQKYEKSYQDKNYKMGDRRKATAIKIIRAVTSENTIETHLDVSAGRGEIVDYVLSLGIPSKGTEIVESLLIPGKVEFAWANSLPYEDKSFDFLTNLDAMEHYLPEQTEEILEEFCRVTKKFIYFAISNKPSYHAGNNLHINMKTYDEWERVLSKYGKVTRPLRNDNPISENFLLQLI